MNILLVYPRYPNTFWSFKHILKFVSKKAAFPPLGLLTVAAMLPREWKKRLVDVNVNELKDEHIEWADMVFISGMVVQKRSAQEIINRCNAKAKTVVAGGPLFTTHYKQFRGVDHFVLGEGEVTIPLFLKDLNKGKPRHIYNSKERPDITSTPVPLWSLINLNDYATMPVQYSRGCPFNCEFCDIVIMNGRVPRTKTTEQVLNEIQTIYNAGWRGAVFIVDDNFIGNKVKVKKMLPMLIRWQKEHKYPFTLLTEASTNLADDNELMQMMSAANFGKVFLGIETPNVESLKECNKMQNVTRNLEDSVRTIQQNGMQVQGGFIVGFDNDTENIFESQIRFIQKVGIVTAMVGILSAFPQTRLWHRLKAEGRLVSDATGENTDGSVNFIPKMGKENLVRGYKKILATIYSPKHYYRRISTFIRNYRPTVRTRVSKSEVQALFRSFWHIGILSRARFQYWKLIIKTAITKRKALPAAIELAIYGFHFQIVVSRVLGV